MTDIFAAVADMVKRNSSAFELNDIQLMLLVHTRGSVGSQINGIPLVDTGVAHQGADVVNPAVMQIQGG
jgi:hypothetical protein